MSIPLPTWLPLALWIVSTAVAAAAEPADPQAGLRAPDPRHVPALHLSFRNADAPLRDESARTWTGVLKGDTHVRDGLLVLDGDGDFVEIPHATECEIRNGLTVALSVRLSPKQPPALHMFLGQADEWLFGLAAEGRLYFNLKGEGGSQGGDWSCSTVSNGNIMPPGKWVHVGAVYQPNTDPLAAAKGRVIIYLDGKQVGTREMMVDPVVGTGPLRIGRLWSDSDHATVWDMKGEMRDLRIYSHALRPADIIALACEQPGIEIEPVIFDVVPDVGGNRIGVRPQTQLSSHDRATLEAAVKAGGARLSVTVETPAQGRTAQTFPFSPDTAVYWLPLEWTDGRHQLAISLTTNDGPVWKATRSVIKPPTPWLNRAAPPLEVLDPWTPLAHPTPHTVECWGRSYTFMGPLPSRVTSGGQDLLRSCSKLEISSAGKRGVFVETSRSSVLASSARAEFRGTGMFPNLPQVRVDWTSWVEYDGVSYATITLTPPAEGASVEALNLSFPVRPESAKYLVGLVGKHPLKFRGSDNETYNTLKLAGARVEIGQFMPYLWLTGDDTGFCTFANSDANWVHQPGTAPLVADGSTEAGLHLRLIARPMHLMKPVTYSFGFQATPIKPLRPGWRSHRWGENEGISTATDILRPWYYSASEGTWLPADGPQLKQWMQTVAAGKACHPYGSLNGTGDNNPVYDFFKPLWDTPGGYAFGPFVRSEQYPSFERDGTRVHPMIGPVTLAEMPIHSQVRVNPGEPSYVEYLSWTLEELQRQAGPVGIYSDLTTHVDPSLTRDLSLANPLQMSPDAFGRMVYDYKLLGVRDLARRLATTLRKYSTPSQRLTWWAHDQNRFCPVYHGYADWWFPGEEYNSVHGTDGPYAFTAAGREEQIRVEGATAQTAGVPSILLTQFLSWSLSSNHNPAGWAARNLQGNVTAEQIEAAGDFVIGLGAVEGMEVLGLWLMREPIQAWWALRRKLGLEVDSARFFRHDRPDCPVRDKSGRAWVSAYGFDGYRAVVVILNRTPDDGPVEVTIDLAGLGFPDGTAPAFTDERTGEAIAWTGMTVSVPVKGRNYTLLSIQDAKTPAASPSP